MRVLTPTENNRLNELIGFLGVVIAILIALALLSYSPHDPSFNVSADSPDVHAALVDIVAEHGGHDRESAEEYLTALKRDSRYRLDVY